MKKNYKNTEISINELEMTNEEFVFIRKKLKISQKDIKFLGRTISQSVISNLEKEDYVNPMLVYQLLSGQYAPPAVIEALRNQWKEKNMT